MPSGTRQLHIHDGHFYERLFRARRAQGYSRKEVEELTEGKVSARKLMRWETKSEAEPRLDPGVRRLAEILGVTLPWLFWGEGDSNGREPRV